MESVNKGPKQIVFSAPLTVGGIGGSQPPRERHLRRLVTTAAQRHTRGIGYTGCWLGDMVYGLLFFTWCVGMALLPSTPAWCQSAGTNKQDTGHHTVYRDFVRSLGTGLWHCSRTTNFCGFLERALDVLRIACPFLSFLLCICWIIYLFIIRVVCHVPSGGGARQFLFISSLFPRIYII